MRTVHVHGWRPIADLAEPLPDPVIIRPGVVAAMIRWAEPAKLSPTHWQLGLSTYGHVVTFHRLCLEAVENRPPLPMPDATAAWARTFAGAEDIHGSPLVVDAASPWMAAVFDPQDEAAHSWLLWTATLGQLRAATTLLEALAQMGVVNWVQMAMANSGPRVVPARGVPPRGLPT